MSNYVKSCQIMYQPAVELSFTSIKQPKTQRTTFCAHNFEPLARPYIWRLVTAVIQKIIRTYFAFSCRLRRNPSTNQTPNKKTDLRHKK